jgi:hypothetical protein
MILTGKCKLGDKCNFGHAYNLSKFVCAVSAKLVDKIPATNDKNATVITKFFL